MSAYYRTSLKGFVETGTELILGELARHQAGSTQQQHEAWSKEVHILKHALRDLLVQYEEAAEWGVLLEYRMFRLHRRIDAVLLVDNIVFVIEFKIGANEYDTGGRRQVEDYALDLKDFHAATDNMHVIPVLCASEAPDKQPEYLRFDNDISNVLLANRNNLSKVLRWPIGRVPWSQFKISVREWDKAPYSPVPNIIEAAEMLYGAHNVDEIHSALADQKNLTTTSDQLIRLIEISRKNSQKAICFVTGVPGSGKTLIGLNAVHDPRFRKIGGRSSAFLSGNTPLVEVLREALARDHQRRMGGTIADARRKTRAEIQLLMRYLEEYEKRDMKHAPHEYVIVFDEAQRAWDAAYGKQKFGREASEPTLFLEIMARHRDWAVIIALVGGGQEINKGEGGLAEWGDALKKFNNNAEQDEQWIVYASPEVIDGSAATAGGVLFPEGITNKQVVYRIKDLHLPVSIRSHRCEVANEWIDAVLEGNIIEAQNLVKSLGDFPIYLTRSLRGMRAWLINTTRGYRRSGLVASSDARRLRGYGLGVTLSTQNLGSIVNWFLCPRGDVRSSYQLEVTATEYACQGLELDRVGLCWGGDMTWSKIEQSWRYRKFRGSRWQNVREESAHQNIKNTYRVLMSRAREALVIWVPPGDQNDPTRPPKRMNETADFLLECGITELENLEG